MTTAAWLAEREEPTPAELRDQAHIGRAPADAVQPYLCDDPWEGKPVPHWHGLDTDTGTVALAVTLLVCILGGLLTLALIAAGQTAMCEARDHALSYCQPAEATR